MVSLVLPVRIEVPDGATHYTGHLLDNETPYSVTYFKRVQEGQPCDSWCVYRPEVKKWFIVQSGHNGTPEWMKPLPLSKPPMTIEICIHGNNITNKLGIACPEGCLSNAQRGLENRELAGELSTAQAKIKEAVCELIQMEVFDSFIVELLTSKIMNTPFLPTKDKS